jgi:signal transduction histidine kinase/DNA-binding response OmpR family regulator
MSRSQSQHSLSRQLLISMGIKIAIVIILATLMSYFYLMSVLKSQTLGQLEKYILERGQRESYLFTLAQDNHLLLKEELYRQLETKQTSQAEFDQLFVKWSDGAIRNRPKDQMPRDFDNTQFPSVFIGPDVNMNADIQHRVVTFYNLLRHYGPAWQKRFVDTYFLAPENIIVIYWPGESWALNAQADLNIQNEEYFYVSNKKNNPKREQVWTGLYFDHVIKHWMVSLETPLDDRQGRHIATIGHDIILNELMERTLHNHLEGTYNLIFRDDGRLIAHPNKMAEIQEQGGQFNLLNSTDQHLIRLFGLVKNNPDNKMIIDNPIDEQYLAVTRIKGPNWYFVTVYPKSLLSTLAFKTASFILILGLLLLLIELAVLFWVLRKHVAKPLNELISATQQITAFSLDAKSTQQQPFQTLAIERNDELGELAKAFNRMGEQLKISFERLDNQNLVFQNIIQDIVQVSHHLAQGQLHVTLKADYQGDLIQIKTALESALSDVRFVIEDIVQVSQGLASGNLQTQPTAEYRGDFKQIQHALETALSELGIVTKDIINVSQGLAEGNLSIMPQSDYQGDFIQIKKALEVALFNQRIVIEDIVQVSQGLADASLNVLPKTEYLGEFNRVKLALETAAQKLAEATTQTAKQDWLKTGQAQLNEQMSGEQALMTLATNIMTFITHRLDAQVGIFYLVEELNRHSQTYQLKLLSTDSRMQHKDVAMAFHFSEGFVGQAALEKKMIQFRIDSALDNNIPPHLLAIPFLYEDIVKGVIELGFTEELMDIQQEFLEQAMPNIAIAINTAQSRKEMQALLEQSQLQADKLQTQQDQLQHSNEELQSQSEELQVQQEELRQINEELEERTEALEEQSQEIQNKNKSLEQTQAEMEKAQQLIEMKAAELELASRYKSEFLANISHELRTPLNSMLILAQLLADNKEQHLTAKQVEYARTIHNAGSDLLNLINEILDLSKIEAGKMEVNLEKIALSDFIETIENQFRFLIENKGLTFHIKLANNLPITLETDVQRLQQILKNLLSNALKFTAEGQITLEIWQHDSSKKGYLLDSKQTIAISVTDSGIGIPEDEQEKIFDAFQQVDGTTSRRYGGTGLGLSISRQLAELLGGQLQVHSEPGQGSTFTLYLPYTPPSNESATLPNAFTQTQEKSLEIKQEDIQEKIQDNQVEQPSTLPMTDGIIDDRLSLKAEDKSILIIEEDHQFADTLIELAHEKGFKCLIAKEGKTGLQMAAHYQPHAIFLDTTLPQIDGWTVMEWLKDNPNTRHIPVHVISDSDHRLDAKKMGAIGYLHKPINLTELGEAFKNIEQFIAQKVKHLLLVVDNQQHQETILEMVGGDDIQITIVITVAEIEEQLQQNQYDCIIIDVDIEKGSGIKRCERLHSQDNLSQVPIILYANRELNREEQGVLQRCNDNLPIKAVRSPERLLDEATLFLHQVEANLSKEKRNMLRMMHEKAAVLMHKKVLIVDDDMRNAYALATLLEDKEMEIVVAPNGKEALSMLEKHQDIAIILIDIMMPEMDGYEAMRRIRQKVQYQKLPIIALTAKAMKSDKAKCIEAGANDYLSKPVDIDKLISLMRVWLYQ